MKKLIQLSILMILISACGSATKSSADLAETESQPKQNVLPNYRAQAKNFPNLQTEILSTQDTLTTSAIGNVDFKNRSFPFPRGWQDMDSKEFTIENGKRPISSERIGMTYLTTKYGDATADGVDEAFVIIRIDTGGGNIPNIVYVYSLKDREPELIWLFRTGDRADGGLKRIFTENREMFVELYGQDRYILGEVETMRIDGDEEQLCCPKYFTRSRYKWNGSNFILQGKRETFSLKDESAPPVENKNETDVKRKDGKK